MKKPKEPEVAVQALMRFPWKGRAIFAGQTFTVSPTEARDLADEKFVTLVEGGS